MTSLECHPDFSDATYLSCPLALILVYFPTGYPNLSTCYLFYAHVLYGELVTKEKKKKTNKETKQENVFLVTNFFVTESPIFRH